MKMAKGYTDLSRRALIKLNNDFDQENDAALMNYLAEHDEEYENVRPVETAIERVDQISESVKKSASVLKDVAMKEIDKCVDKLASTIVSVASGK